MYIDNMVVKSKLRRDHIVDLEETFKVLRRCGVKLNPTKCSFRVSLGQFLGYIANKRGIKPNSEKVVAILQIGESERQRRIFKY